MRLAIEQKDGKSFMGRELRVKKAVSAQRLEKKRVKTEEKVKQIKAFKKANVTMVKDGEKDGENQENDKDQKMPGISCKSKGIKKDDKDDSEDFRKSFKKIVSNSGRANSIENNGLDMTPRLAFAKKKQMKVMKEKIESGGFSKYEHHKSHETTKQVPTHGEALRSRIAKRKKVNLKNINSVKVKRVHQ